MSEKSIRGESFCAVERSTGQVLAFPSSISPTRIRTEYAQVVDRASPVSDQRRSLLTGHCGQTTLLKTHPQAFPETS
jgi:hypothetical protein